MTREPGARGTYSDAGPAILALVVEAITREPIDRFVERRVPRDAHIAVEPNVWPGGTNAGGNMQPYPFFGPNLSRTVTLADGDDLEAAKSRLLRRITQIEEQLADMRAVRAGDPPVTPAS